MKLAEERIDALDDIGFNWKPQRVSFEERVAQLIAYEAKHGHLNVTESEDKSLYRFCYYIRRSRRYLESSGRMKNLTEERIASLDAIGFDWKILPNNDEESFSELDGELLPDWIDDYEDEGNWDEGGILQREEL